MMIDKKEFGDMARELERVDALREEVIVESRKILKHSKKAIYDVHAGHLDDSAKEIGDAKKLIDAIRKKVGDQDVSTGMLSEAMQEYTEAVTFLEFVRNGRLATTKEVGADIEDYLMGITDLTGELGRRAVYLTAKEQYKEIAKIYDFVNQIQLLFLEFTLRNSELRKKSDSVKWNLKKIEEIMYDLKIRDKI